MIKLKTWISKAVHWTDRVISNVAMRSALLYTGWGDHSPHANATLKCRNSDLATGA